MSAQKGKMYHPVNGSTEVIWSGFSWPCLLFGCFWYLYKAMWGWALISLGVSVITYGIAWFIFPFFANGQHEASLLKKGYFTEAAWRDRGAIPQSQAQASATSTTLVLADELSKLEKLRKDGVLTDAEFAEQKRRLLA